MSITAQIKDEIKNIPIGKTFGYKDLNVSSKKITTAAKVIERLIKKGVIKKIAKGTFYKPEITVFGELKPSENEIIKPYLFEKGKRIAYITAELLYNQLGLTTQIPATIKIASLKRIYINKGAIKAKPVKSYVEVTDENFYILGLLDAIKDFKKIPDLDTNNALKRLGYLIENLEIKQLDLLMKLALKYPPRARALLGAIAQNLEINLDLTILKNSLNPLSEYKLGISKKELPTSTNWNIV